MRISLIMPVYNTPIDLFERCMKSINSQRYRNIQLIVIDDGSCDNLSLEYNKLCQQMDGSIYNKTSNYGVSHARNVGIAFAEGEYIAFVDSDDIIDIAFLENAVYYAKLYSADLIIGKIEYIPKMNVNQKIPELLVEKDSGKVLEYLFDSEEKSKYKFLGSPCGRLYRTEIAKRILFDENLKYWEDQIYNREFIKASKLTVLVPECWYYYMQNKNSALHCAHKKWNQMEDWIKYWNKWEQLNEQCKSLDERKLFEKKNIDFFYNMLHEGIVAGEKYSKRIILEMLMMPVFQKTCELLSVNDMIKYKDKMRLLLMKFKRVFMMYVLVLYKCRKDA